MSAGWEISLANGTEREQRTADQLRTILATRDVSRWTFTRTIAIEERAIPHSHPVLTLNTRHLSDDGQLLSTFLHEQIHWLVKARRSAAGAAVREIKRRYAVLPTGHPEGATDLDGSYLHVVVNYLELVAMEEVAGEGEAARVFDVWLNDHYTTLYGIVLDDREVIAEIVARHGLMP
ncbi:MAG: hypothetical protein WD359_02895 [Dehalococcoidia bacterium]